MNTNHYHILINVPNGTMLGGFINNLHSNITRLINKIDGLVGRQIWYQYWDRCIRSESDFYTRLNYIHHNPIKHGLAEKMEKYKWSSYNKFLDDKGEDWLDDCFSRYPIRDFTLEDED